ncbi:HD-GYP domain-containing protein [Anaeromicropila populeti]|uniref:HD domain-containing protein n=1 Tax=Anaeromicropila populeti TaxID=37658 RepID=A0A1I6J1E0_9FIRM|nr:HD domain-containing phosphohydrolase [Anaeromicropila populeti]SFR72824.1 HD domain-containing protein [Anaeromicropila populeti]
MTQGRSKEEFFVENDLKANTLVRRIMYGMIGIWPLLIAGSFIGAFHISIKNTLSTFLMTVLVDLILLLLTFRKAPPKIIKYYCLISIELVVATMAIFPRIGINMSYIVAPVISCIYFDKKLTKRIAIYGYFMMIFAWFFRSKGLVEYAYPDSTRWNCFFAFSCGFSIEYATLAVICVTISKRARLLSEKLFSRNNKIERMQTEMIYSFANLIESRDDVTGKHVKRTSAYVKVVAEALRSSGFYFDELDDTYVEYICLAAPIHDIGKIRIPDAVLLKPAQLTDEEYALIKTHTIRGEEIIRKTLTNIENKEFLECAAHVALYHHEKWDGTGYPEGLEGRNIPLCARIMAIADVFDALVSERYYKGAMSLNEAFQRIEDSSGTHFEPLIVDVFLEKRNEIEEICRLNR